MGTVNQLVKTIAKPQAVPEFSKKHFFSKPLMLPGSSGGLKVVKLAFQRTGFNNDSA